MPKKPVFEFECDRCHKKWYPEAKRNGEPPSAGSLKVTFDEGDPQNPAPAFDREFEVLCEGCTITVGNYLKMILKVKVGESGAKENDDGVAPAVAPGFTTR